MSKMRALLVGATAAGAFAAASFIPARADSAPVGSGISIEYSQGDATFNGAYLVLAGDETAPVHGYIGVSTLPGDGGVIGCMGSSFSDEGGNNVILPPTGQIPDPNDPCAPALPGAPELPAPPL